MEVWEADLLASSEISNDLNILTRRFSTLTVRAGAVAGPPAAQSAAVGRAVAGDPALPDGGAAGVGVLLLGLGVLVLRTGGSHEVRIMSGLTPVLPAW